MQIMPRSEKTIDFRRLPVQQAMSSPVPNFSLYALFQIFLGTALLSSAVGSPSEGDSVQG